jgi:hypothetical protein
MRAKNKARFTAASYTAKTREKNMQKLFSVALVTGLLAGIAHAQTNKPLADFHAQIVEMAGDREAAMMPGFDQIPLLRPYGAVIASAKWPTASIPVCWQNASAAHKEAMDWTRDAVQRTWETASRVRFTGWKPCAAVNNGIRIRISDVGPHVTYLGRYLQEKKGEMVLNFSFSNWSYNCQTSREDCIRAIAVHEFGHALSFTHEQNRADTPGECKLLAQGTNPDTALTPFDPDSVMNYCNKKWNNGGLLSKEDKKAVAFLYGAP